MPLLNIAKTLDTAERLKDSACCKNVCAIGNSQFGQRQALPVMVVTSDGLGLPIEMAAEIASDTDFM